MMPTNGAWVAFRIKILNCLRLGAATTRRNGRNTKASRFCYAHATDQSSNLQQLKGPRAARLQNDYKAWPGAFHFSPSADKTYQRREEVGHPGRGATGFENVDRILEQVFFSSMCHHLMN